MDGSESKLPVLEACICINLSQHPRCLDTNDPRYYESIVARTRTIARELLYIEQFFKFFDPATGLTLQPINEPTDEQIDRLICPCYIIEAFLHSTEARAGIQFQSEKDFIERQDTVNVNTYFRTWLTNRGVPRDVCALRTCIYLNSGMRAHHEVMKAALNRFIRETNSDVADPYILRRHMIRSSRVWETYLKDVRKNGCKCTLYDCHCTDHEIAEFAMLLIRRHGAALGKKPDRPLL